MADNLCGVDWDTEPPTHFAGHAHCSFLFLYWKNKSRVGDDDGTE